MRQRSILIAIVAGALALPAWAQQPAPAANAAEAKAEATFAALAPLVANHSAALSAAGAQTIVARTGKRNRDIEVLTRWGPAYFAWPKGVKPVTFEIYIESANRLDVTADGFTEATKPLYAAAFDAVLPKAVKAANDLRALASRPKR